MSRDTPFFITASLLIATFSLALPDLDLETAAETQQAQEGAAHGVTGARDDASREARS